MNSTQRPKEHAVRLLPVHIVMAALIVGAAQASVFALAGVLDAPGVSFAKDYPASSRALVMKALNRADCKFLGGSFINWSTTLRYAGGSHALNAFMGDLTKCPHATINIRFRKDLSDADWEVSHTPSGGDRFDILINLTSQQVKLDELMLPEFKVG
jgi:hypothetical protein